MVMGMKHPRKRRRRDASLTIFSLATIALMLGGLAVDAVGWLV